MQFEKYNDAREFFIKRPDVLSEIERFCISTIADFINSKKDEIRKDYNESSFLYPFWQNYPPDERGRQPKGDQFPWIEVGEQVFGSKLSRYMAEHFKVSDAGIPTGPDDRYVISSDEIKSILGITDSAWLFVDIKSVGPRDDQDHAVMSHNQISGNGKWKTETSGVKNDIMSAEGARVGHQFHCAIPPLYVLSSGKVAPVITIVIKPVYDMLALHGETGQPLKRVSIVCIPNGLLLSENPNYLQSHKGLLFPGKDDKDKNPLKVRARVSFEKIRSIDEWRFVDIPF